MATDHLSTTFAALADPTRRAILARLVKGEASVTELAAPLKDATDWLDQYRRFWEQSFDRLEAHLRALQAKGKKSGRRK
jgi:DNA-binding transcriptional ArsR family regulator